MYKKNHPRHQINRRATTLFLAAMLTTIFLAGAIWGADLFDITIDLGGGRIFSHSGELSDPLQTANFADQLNTYLQTCTPDAEGMCDVPLHVTTNRAIKLQGLEVYYTITDENVLPQNTTNNNSTNNNSTSNNLTNNTQNQAPAADFTFTPGSGTAPITIEFDATASNDPDGSITSYSWTLGQIPERTQTGKMTTYTFEQPGEFTVTLTVTDNQGMTSSTQHRISVRQRPNQPPIALFTASPTSGNTPLKVSFDASESNDPDGRIVLYGWDFGDNTQGSGKTTEHTYTQPGRYLITLAVQDNQEASANTKLGIEVLGPMNKPPILASNLHFTIRKSGSSPWFRVDAYDPDGDPLKYAIEGMPRLYHTYNSGANMVDLAMNYHPSPMFSTLGGGWICENWYGTLKVSDGKDETKSPISVLVC